MAGAPVYQVALGSIADSMVLAPARINGINTHDRIDEASYDVVDPKQIQGQLSQFGSRSSTTGLPPEPKPSSVHIVLYGDDHMVLHLQHLGFRHIRRAGAPTGANEVIYPPGSPALGWLAARAMGTGNVYVTPGDVDAVVMYE
jgi:hypothetical protein